MGSSTGENLYKTILHELKTIGLYAVNISEQGYDSGDNLKGHTSGTHYLSALILPKK